MARKTNTGTGETSGHGEIDTNFTPPGPVYPEPGARNLNDPDWVRRDMLNKTSKPQPKYY
jgi:hypothetical protein